MTETPGSPDPSDDTSSSEDERHHAEVDRNIPDAAEEAAADGTLTAVPQPPAIGL